MTGSGVCSVRAERLVAKVERREAPRPTSLGARGSLAARGGYVNPASKGARWCPGASRRSIPSRRFARDRQTSDASRREHAKAWLFESVNIEIYATTPPHTQRHTRA